jgi:hypothetical protein
MGELALELKKMATGVSSQAVAGLASELGTITPGKGVKLDRFSEEFRYYLALAPLCDIDVELTLQVPAHEETGQIELPGLPSSDPTNHPPTEAGTYSATFKLDDWSYDAEGDSEKYIKITGARVKFAPEFQEGDRVLCALVNGGRDVVIISKVVDV